MTGDLAVAFPNNDTSEHFEKINNAIHEMKTDGTLETILVKYGVNTAAEEEVSTNDQN